MIIQAMKQDLKAAGHTDEQIRQMTPIQAHEALAVAAKAAETPTPTSPIEDKATRDALTQGIFGAKSTPETSVVTKLPEGLAGAKPRYSYGQKQFGLQFESDADRAAYIAATVKQSKRVKYYAAFAGEALGMSPEEVVAHGNAIRDRIKEMAKDAKPGLLKIGAVGAAGAAAGAVLNPDAPGQGAKEGIFLPVLSRIMSHGEKITNLEGVGILRAARKEGTIGSSVARETVQKLNDRIASGVDPVELHRRTGFYQDEAKNWRWELSDHNIGYVPGSEGKVKAGETVPLKELITHPEFQKFFPKLFDDIKVQFKAEDTDPGRASVNLGTNTIKVHPSATMKVIIHELQHIVDEYEGLPSGTSPSHVRGLLEARA